MGRTEKPSVATKSSLNQILLFCYIFKAVVAPDDNKQLRAVGKWAEWTVSAWAAFYFEGLCCIYILSTVCWHVWIFAPTRKLKIQTPSLEMWESANWFCNTLLDDSKLAGNRWEGREWVTEEHPSQQRRDVVQFPQHERSAHDSCWKCTEPHDKDVWAAQVIKREADVSLCSKCQTVNLLFCQINKDVN